MNKTSQTAIFPIDLDLFGRKTDLRRPNCRFLKHIFVLNIIILDYFRWRQNCTKKSKQTQRCIENKTEQQNKY
jgi:hypothetical protein